MPFSCCVFYAICKRQFLVSRKRKKERGSLGRSVLGDFHLYGFVDKFYFIIGLRRSSHHSHTRVLANDCFAPTEIVPPNDNVNNVKFSSIYLTLSSRSSLLHRQLLVPFDEPATFVNLALLITFTLALVQALLSLIGAVIACLWSPCCADPVGVHKPVATHSHYAQTTPSRFEGGAHHPPPLRSMRRPQLSETHRYIITNDSPDPVMNGFLQRSPLLRSNYDDV